MRGLFEPFGEVRVNPSWECVKGLDGEVWGGRVLVRAVRLPVSYERGPARLREELKPDDVVIAVDTSIAHLAAAHGRFGTAWSAANLGAALLLGRVPRADDRTTVVGLAYLLFLGAVGLVLVGRRARRTLEIAEAAGYLDTPGISVVADARVVRRDDGQIQLGAELEDLRDVPTLGLGRCRQAAARGDREAEGEGLEDARIVRVGLEQTLHRHAVFEGFLRVFALVDGARRVGDGVAEAFAFRSHEQQFFDGVVIAPGQVEAAGVAGVDDAALPEFHGPGDGAAGGGRVQPEVVEDVVEAQHLLGLAQVEAEKALKELVNLLKDQPDFPKAQFDAGSIGDVNHEAKRVVLERILADIGPRGLAGLVTFGDGYVEIANTVEVGGLAVGAATEEAEMAGVMAHEIAHVTARHVTKNMTKAEIDLLAAEGYIRTGNLAAAAALIDERLWSAPI